MREPARTGAGGQPTTISRSRIRDSV